MECERQEKGETQAGNGGYDKRMMCRAAGLHNPGKVTINCDVYHVAAPLSLVNLDSLFGSLTALQQEADGMTPVYPDLLKTVNLLLLRRKIRSLPGTPREIPPVVILAELETAKRVLQETLSPGAVPLHLPGNRVCSLGKKSSRVLVILGEMVANSARLYHNGPPWLTSNNSNQRFGGLRPTSSNSFTQCQ